MFAFNIVVSLTVSSLLGLVTAFDLDTNSPDSIKSVAKTLASSIISKYDADLRAYGPPGLFEDYYFWEAGTIWNALVGYFHLTGDSQYNEMISNALQWQTGAYDSFMPMNQTRSLGNDDQSCWGLAAMTAAEVGLPKPKDREWITLATNVWETQAARLDSEYQNGTCGGGLRWQIFAFNNGYEYKDSWSNGNFFLLSARLAKFTGNSTFSAYADKSFQWARSIGLVNKEYHAYDGAEMFNDCEDVNKIQWSAQHGIYTEGTALMYNMTGAQNWTDFIQGFVNSLPVFQESTSSPIIVEVACEKNGKCNTDQRAFKGVFARTLARAALAAPIVKDSINKILSTSARAAANACKGNNENTKCSLEWTGDASAEERASSREGNLGEVFDALEVVQGLLYPQAKALGSSGSSQAEGNVAQNGTVNSPKQTGAADRITLSFTTAFTLFAVSVLGYYW